MKKISKGLGKNQHDGNDKTGRVKVKREDRTKKYWKEIQHKEEGDNYGEGGVKAEHTLVLVLAKAAKTKRYEQWCTQYKQNILFKQDQKRFRQELNGMAKNESVNPDADESKKSWTDILSVGKVHNRSAEWLNNIKNDIGDNQQREPEITPDMVTSRF